MYDAEIINQCDRYIMTKCSGFSDVQVEIRYKDGKFKQLAENERIELMERKQKQKAEKILNLSDATSGKQNAKSGKEL